MPNPVLDRLHDERQNLLDQVDQIAAAAEGEDRDLSSAEQELISRCHGRIVDGIDPQLDELERIERARVEHARATPVVHGSNGSTGAVEVPPDQIYRTFAQYARDEIIVRNDNIGSLVGPGVRAAAQERLARAVVHTTTTDVPGLLPPQHIAQIMQVISTARPLVAASRQITLTAGKITYPRITARPTVGKQAAEKTEAASTEMTVIMVEKVASTFLGAGNLSWQVIQWSSPDALALWFDLAAEDYARKTEAETGAIFGVGFDPPPIAVAAPGDLAAWMAAIATAAGQINTATGRFADTIAADPVTGYKLLSLVSAQAPVFISAGQLSLRGEGNIAGLRFVLSNGLPANTVIVGDFTSLITAETAGAPVELRAVEPSIAGFQVGVVGAFLVELVEEDAFRKLTPPAP